MHVGGAKKRSLWASGSCCGPVCRRMWKKISRVGVRSLVRRPTQGWHRVEKLQAMAQIPDLLLITCCVLDLSAITGLSKPWLSCKMRVLVLSLHRGWTNEWLCM